MHIILLEIIHFQSHTSTSFMHIYNIIANDWRCACQSELISSRENAANMKQHPALIIFLAANPKHFKKIISKYCPLESQVTFLWKLSILQDLAGKEKISSHLKMTFSNQVHATKKSKKKQIPTAFGNVFSFRKT